MARPVVTVAAGGYPVVDVTATKPALGTPVTEAVSGFGRPVTKVTPAIGGLAGLAVTYVSTLTDGAGGGSSLMLDGITTGLKAAYSTRKLLTAYGGSALRLQRLSDNAQTDIGFSSGVLDTAAVATFCSGTTGRVITWYDQSGGGFNLTQGTFAAAPILYQAGAVNMVNSTRPAPLFVAASTTSLTSASLALNPAQTLFQNAVTVFPGAAANGAITGGTASNNLEWRVQNSTRFMELLAGNVASIATANIAQAVAGSVLETQYNSVSGVGNFWVDGAAAGSFTSAKTFAGGSTFILGGYSAVAGGEPFQGSIGEYLAYDLVGGIPSGSRTTIETNQKAYWGTP